MQTSERPPEDAPTHSRPPDQTSAPPAAPSARGEMAPARLPAPAPAAPLFPPEITPEQTRESERLARLEKEKDLEQFAETWWNVVGTFLFAWVAAAWIACTFVTVPIKLPGFPDIPPYTLPLFSIPVVFVLLAVLHGVIGIYRFGRGPVSGWQKLVPGLAVPRKSLGWLRLIPVLAFIVFPTASMFYFKGKMDDLEMREEKSGQVLKSSGPENYYNPPVGRVQAEQTWYWVNPNPPKDEKHGVTAFPVTQPRGNSILARLSGALLLSTLTSLLWRTRKSAAATPPDSLLRAAGEDNLSP